ncbi:MAG TPA: PLP-dependent cysteine synthase family protein [Stackebrandtia sp.]|jgi:cysteine synthase A|uniref:PLP-dependent cysteine synthase family protein n=1 Tax=Stackebrandtia sp. TaxID=2023065 RepID=UPI002D2D6BDE|nr:PLP-dependent cysteine synthase family protein [Stackebrandtia sp.]HZE38850.1 PLP-dependent cysteine synthase family protein [Stackebrandtia sp.]
MDTLDRCCDQTRGWVNDAIAAVAADANRSADTHLLPFPLCGDWGIDLYLKDESVHPTGSLKHRLARSLFLYALCNGWITEGTPVIEASSGSTAVSEAYFARMLGLPFIAVMPATTSGEKIALIEFHDGVCHLVEDPSKVVSTARALAAERGGHYMDQFTYAERATDWRGNNNIAESIYQQMAAERHPIPAWIVVGAGTGGTSATVGRWIRYQRHCTKLCVVDPENSAFFDGWRDHDPEATVAAGSRIEGIGRPRVEPSFIPTVVDRMMKVPDAASVAVLREASAKLGRRLGGSTGTNLYAAFALIAELRSRGETGSVVTLLCDSGDRYANSYFSDSWVDGHGLDLAPYTETARRFMSTGEWVEPS